MPDSQIAKLFIHLLLSTMIDNNKRLIKYVSLSERLDVSIMELLWCNDFIGRQDSHESFNVLLIDSQYEYIRNKYIDCMNNDKL